MDKIKSFVSSESGATAIEYALISALIAAFVIVAMAALGDAQSGMYTHIRDKVVPALGGNLNLE